MSNEYAAFLERKAQIGTRNGFSPVWMPDFLFDFQRALVEWSLEKGRAAIFADTGLGKGPMALVWAENVVRHSDKPVLIVTPLAVSYQMVREAEKFGILAERSQDGTVRPWITVTNYERLGAFNAQDFGGMVCDESGCLKDADSVTRKTVTEFMRRMPYRLLCSATPSPNDHIELGTSSEAIGELGYIDVLTRFFKNTVGTISTHRHRGRSQEWRFRGHAEQPFWRWIASWARVCRKPSDMGGDDALFQLPPLYLNQTVITNDTPRNNMLFVLPANTLHEQREERRLTLKSRCEAVAKKVSEHDRSLVWTHLQAEADLLEKMIPQAEQVQGSDTDEIKEQRFLNFAEGRLPVLITKPSIAAWGLNFQRCAHMTTFPSHSFEQWYQSIRRCWRFGQTRPVIVDMITTDGESRVLENLQRKAEAADHMYTALVQSVQQVMAIERTGYGTQTEEIPRWL